MTQQQIINLIVVALVAGSSVISWIFRKLAEQAALKRAEAARERQKLETLRTGRGDDEDEDKARRSRVLASPAPTAARTAGPEDLEQLAKRRAEQLRQLRELQAAKQRSAGNAPPSPRPMGDVIARVPGSSGPTVPGTRAGSRPPVLTPSGQARVEERRAKQARQARKAELEELRRAESEALRRTLAASTPLQDRSSPLAPQPREGARNSFGENRPELARKAHPSPLAGMTRADWKRAFLAKEVLGEPVSMRVGHLE